MNKAIALIVYCMVTTAVWFFPAPGISPDMTQHEVYELYYAPQRPALYGYATRYGSDEVALRELVWEAHEYAAQRDHGFALIGGGYGYHLIDGVEYLADNRASYAYGLLRQLPARRPTLQQRMLENLDEMSWGDIRAFVQSRYIGIVSLKSPNDIGREFCLLRFPVMEPVGLVIVGGTAARHDWAPYGSSVNDYYGHRRMGERVLLSGDGGYNWVADISDRAYYAAGGEGGALLVAIGPTYLCTGCPYP